MLVEMNRILAPAHIYALALMTGLLASCTQDSKGLQSNLGCQGDKNCPSGYLCDIGSHKCVAGTASLGDAGPLPIDLGTDQDGLLDEPAGAPPDSVLDRASDAEADVSVTSNADSGGAESGGTNGSGGASGTGGTAGGSGTAGRGGANGSGGMMDGGGGMVDGGGKPASGGSGGMSTTPVVNCGSLSSPANGLVRAPYTTAGSTAEYGCLAGYALSGSSTRICQATGSWTGTAPTCVQSAFCPALPDPPGGTVFDPTLTYGATATYACRTGYAIVGLASRTCQADGTWTGPAPTCVPVDCGTPAALANGAVSAPATTYPSTATYSCLAGYTLSGLATLTCQSNGTWSGNAPSCVCAGTVCNGVCVDTQKNTNHCGGCDTVCSAVSPSTVECIGGRCLTTLTSTDKAYALAVDNTSVYWSTIKDNIMKVSISGGSPVTLASGQSTPEDLVVDATSVYWVNYNGATVMKVPLAGGATTAIATGQSYAGGLAVDANSVYWANGNVMKVPLNGGLTTPVTSGTPINSWDLVVDSTYVYWTSPSSVMRVPVNGGALSTLASGLLDPQGLAVDATSIYWVNHGTSGSSYTDGSVMKVPLAGGDTTTLAPGQTSPTSIAVDGTNVYWTNSASAGTVMKVPLGGGASTTLVSGRFYPDAIAVDATSIYWTDGGKSGSGFLIMKLTPK